MFYNNTDNYPSLSLFSSLDFRCNICYQADSLFFVFTKYKVIKNFFLWKHLDFPFSIGIIKFHSDVGRSSEFKTWFPNLLTVFLLRDWGSCPIFLNLDRLVMVLTNKVYRSDTMWLLWLGDTRYLPFALAFLEFLLLRNSISGFSLSEPSFLVVKSQDYVDKSPVGGLLIPWAQICL